jgi:hypothetical protein
MGMVFFVARRDGFETFHDLPSSKKVSARLLQSRRTPLANKLRR